MIIDEAIFGAELRRGHVDFELGDGRHVHIPIDWLPKLQAAGPGRCGSPVVSADGRRAEWPAIGEAISIERVLARRR
jgi:hypothetical protein